MTGSWHIYRPADVWQKPAAWAAVQLATERCVVVCFSPKLLQLITATQLARDPWLQRLGPDILGAPIDDDVFLARMRSQRDRAIGEAVMNQSVVCGIGNVYKSEILFLEGVHPQTPVSRLTDECLLRLRDQAVFLMRRNVDAAPRRTRFRADSLKLWVYGRQSQECLKCGSVLQLLRQGDTNRSTCFCPVCQPA
jgi:endonuclease-8